MFDENVPYNAQQPIQTGAHNSLMYRVYGWMALGLTITAAMAWYVAATPLLRNAIFQHWWVLLLLCIAQLGLVFTLSIGIARLSFQAAATLFLLYSLLNGATIASIFLVFTMSSIFATFIVAAGMFGFMSIYGYITKTDLTSMGNILFMILIGLIIALFVNMFIQSAGLDKVISFIGVIVFALLTAYDTQKIKQLASTLRSDYESYAKAAILGALTLYLDFINMFLFLLQFTGKRRD